MKPYIIWVGNWSSMSSGGIVLHLLAKHLKELGQEVYISSDDQNPNFKLPHMRDFVSNKTKTIGVYPEIVGGGNPFNCSTVVHYLLNIPEFFGIPYIPQKNHLEFIYSHFFNQRVKLPEDHIMFISCFDEKTFNIFYDKKKYRKGYYYYRGKGNQPFYESLIHIPELIIGSRFFGKQEELCDIFNSIELLYVYDNCTAVMEIARMCGCPIIIIPDGNWSKKECQTHSSWKCGGIGYDLEEEEIARKTIDAEKIKNFYEFECKEATKISINTFINETQSKGE